MIRLSSIAALFILSAALVGCGGGESSDSTDPSKLAALSEAERAEMTQHDAEVADAEKAQMLLSPDAKGSKRSKKKVDPNRTESVF